MKHAISPSGIIHKVCHEGYDHSIKVLCGAGGNRWGNNWRLTSNGITCKRCLTITNPDRHGSVMISRKNIRKYVQLLADIREELASPSVFKGSPGILRRLTNVQNSLHAKILPPVIMQLLNKNCDPQKHSPLKGGHDALMNLGSFTS